MFTGEQVKEQINAIKEGVDKSEFGPMFVRSTENITEKKINQIALQIFLVILQREKF